MTVGSDFSESLGELPPEETPGLPSAEPPAAVFGALKAAVALVLLVLVQFFTGIAVFIVAMIVAVAQGRDVANRTFANELINEITVPLLLVTALVSTLTVFVIARIWAWQMVRDTSSAGVGLTPATLTQILGWFCAGALVAAIYVFVALRIVPFDPSTPLGPLAAAASRGGIERLAWALLALVFAPFVEEFFFRGLLFAGFARSWGSRAGAIIVTVLFIAMHLFETFRYWPAIVAVTLLAIGAMAARRLTDSLAPAMTFHAGYNLVIVVMAFIAQGTA